MQILRDVLLTRR